MESLIARLSPRAQCDPRDSVYMKPRCSPLHAQCSARDTQPHTQQRCLPDSVHAQCSTIGIRSLVARLCVRSAALGIRSLIACLCAVQPEAPCTGYAALWLVCAQCSLWLGVLAWGHGVRSLVACLCAVQPLHGVRWGTLAWGTLASLPLSYAKLYFDVSYYITVVQLGSN